MCFEVTAHVLNYMNSSFVFDKKYGPQSDLETLK